MADVSNRSEWPPNLDAVMAAPKNHRVLWDDEAVRVLEVSVEPGEREQLHHHQWPSLMIVLSRPEYVNYDANGNEIGPAIALPADPVLPVAARLPPQRPHFVEVPASEQRRLHAIRVEFKKPC
jgi:hypothetical protein